MRRRMLNPEFFTDPDIIANLDFGGRLFYEGTWCIADDSGVFEPNILGLKMKIFPGDNIELSVIQGYYDKLIELKKFIEFNVDGRTYAWIKNFHKHQKLDRPSPPILPLPGWIKWHGDEEYGKEKHRWHYEVFTEYLIDDNSTTIRRTLPEQDTTEENRKEVKGSEKEKEKDPPNPPGGIPQPSASVTENDITPAEISPKGEGAQSKTAGKGDIYSAEFEEFWGIYPRKVEKKRAYRCWKARVKETKPGKIIIAAQNYAVAMQGTDPRYIKHPATFLGPDKPFEEWIVAATVGNTRAAPEHIPLAYRSLMEFANQGGETK